MSDVPWIRSLTWDSAFFGRRIGRLQPDASETTDLGQVARLDRSAFDCVYVDLDIAAAHSVDRWIELGARPVDTRAELVAPVLELPLSDQPNAAERLLSWTDADREDAVALAHELSRWSRFALDPAFAGSAAGLYRRWIELALTREHETFVERIDGRLAGLLTASFGPDTAWIELLVVADAHRGSGIGASLIGGMLAEAKQRAKVAARVRTQLRNVPAIRAYERAGFRIAGANFVLHWWSR